MTTQNLPIYARAKDIARLFGISVSKILADTKTGNFPQPYKPSAGTTLWKISEVASFIENGGKQNATA